MIKKFLFTALFLLPQLSFGDDLRKFQQHQQGPGSLYSNKGSNLGYNKNGNVYNQNGQYSGAMRSSGNSSRFYGANSQYMGESFNGNYYNSNGKYQGKAMTSGNTTRFYDANGRNLGSAQKVGNTVKFYDQNGKSLGTKR